MPGTQFMKALALLSGGLDSTLAVLLMKEQGIEVEAVNFQTMFTCCKSDARRVAHDLGVPLTLLEVGDDYLKVIEKPRFGYGRGMNPCVDCRIYMFEAAKALMEKSGASFLVTGEVLDQRPKSQKMNDFRTIERESGLEGKILRPLSAKLLPETEAESRGWVNREKLHAVHGQSRQFLLELAAHYGIENPPPASPGCALTMEGFAKKVKDVFAHHPDYERWEFEILKVGRHFRLDAETKAVIGRSLEQNEYLEVLHPAGTTLLLCKNFGGPHALVIGNACEANLNKAGALMLRYAQKPLPPFCDIETRSQAGTGQLTLAGLIQEELVESLRVV
jgi:tRNA-specific 2-thiouridylase